MRILAGRSRGAIGRLAGITGIVCNLLLFGGKLAAGVLSGSVSITADAWNNLSDCSSAAVTLLGFHLASKPADKEHPFGHARFEYLSSLLVSVLILLIGLELGQSAIRKILSPAPIRFSPLILAILLVSIAVKLFLAFLNRKLGRKIQSEALAATATDSLCDVVATSAVLLSCLLSHFFSWNLDGWFGAAVALFILFSGAKSAKSTIDLLLGKAMDPVLVQTITDAVRAHPNVLGIHDLLIHDYGPGRRFASAHVEMDSALAPMDCHETIDTIEREIQARFQVELVLHYDPVDRADPLRRKLLRILDEAAQALDPGISLHDFRIEQDADATVLRFDLSIPFSLPGEKERLRASLAAALPDDRCYRLAITFDEGGTPAE